MPCSPYGIYLQNPKGAGRHSHSAEEDTKKRTAIFQVLKRAEEKSLVFQAITLLPAELFILIWTYLPFRKWTTTPKTILPPWKKKKKKESNKIKKENQIPLKM